MYGMPRGQKNFSALNLNGREKVVQAPTDRICAAPGCNAYVNAGDSMVKYNGGGGMSLHPACAQGWANLNDVEANYLSK